MLVVKFNVIVRMQVAVSFARCFNDDILISDQNEFFRFFFRLWQFVQRLVIAV